MDQPNFFPFSQAPGAPAGTPDGPLITGEYTQLQSMRFAPAFGYQPNAKLSFGLAGIVEYSNLDLGSGSAGIMDLVYKAAPYIGLSMI